VTLAEEFNKYEVSASTGKDGVTLEACPNDDTLFDKDGFVTDEDFTKFLDKLDTTKAYVAEHPYGSGGGLVVWAEHDQEQTWYDAHSECEWR
jgi:hypothetical protein